MKLLGVRLAAAAAMTAATAVAAGTAGAAATHHERASLADAQLGSSKAELVAQRDHSTQVIRFFTTGHRWMLAPQHTSCRSVPWTRTCTIARERLRAHRWLHDLAVDRYQRLYAPPPGHYALWNCIHLGVNGGAAYGQGEGNSSSGTYTGPLQMTSGWAGYDVSDWSALPTEQVYAMAESQYVAHGYSTGWLRGQWPNTSPPCMQYA